MCARLSQHSELTVGAIVLAAGAGSRLGHRPKCLLELTGETLIRRQLRILKAAGIDDIAVVLGYYADQIAPAIENFSATLVHNPAPDAGQNASLHCGLRALPQPHDAVMVVLADQPLLEPRDISDVIHAFAQRPQATELVVPRLGDVPGNPVIFSAAVKQAILAQGITFGGKQWQHANPERVYHWPTANEHYRIDIDTQDDIDALAARTGRRLQWPPANDSTQ